MKRRVLTVLLAVCLVLALGTVTAFADETVATVNGTDYESLEAAIGAAGDGDTVQLTADISVDAVITINTSITLDLNGHIITNNVAGDSTFCVTASSFTVDGTAAGSGMSIPENNSGSYGFIKVADTSAVTLNGGTYSGNTDNGAFVKIFCDNDVDASGSTVIFNNVTMTSNNRFFSTDTLATGSDTPTLQVSGGIYTTTGQAFGVDVLYASTVTFTNATVTAGTGPCIEVCGPAATFENCAFTVTGTNSNGFGTTAVAVSYGGTAVIDGGSYSAEKGYGIYAYSSGGTINVVSGTITGGTAAARADVDRNTYSSAVSTVNITGGTINGSLQTSNDDNANIVVTGGTFNTDTNVNEYIPEGAALEWDPVSGEVAVVGSEVEAASARIDDVYYDTLSNAIAAAKDGDTVTLLGSTTCDSRVYIDSDITLDLGGNTLNSTADFSLLVEAGNSLTLQSGTLNNSVGGGVFGFSGSSITVEGDASIVSEGAGVMGSNNKAAEGNVTFNIYGTIDSNDIGVWGQGPNNTMNIIGATIYSNYFGVYQNGSFGGCEVVIINSTIVDTYGNGVYISNSKENAEDSSQGMQNLTIENSSITGPTAVEVKYTNVSVSGENTVLTATGDPPDQTLNNNGSVSTGYALAITHNGTSTTADSAGGDTIVTEGTFIGLIGIQSPTFDAEPTSELIISGGRYSVPVSKEYLADNLNAELYSHSNADAPYSYYSSVEEALEAAQPGDIVTDLSDIAADSADAKLTFDYGNGNVETVTSKVGAEITLTSPTRSGYTFGGWRSGGTVYEAGETVKVTGDMTFTAIWNVVNIPDTYDIDIADTANGTVSVSLSNASAGSVITVTVEPDEGYELGSLTVTGPDGRVEVTRVNASTYRFTMPDGDVTVRATFVSEGLPFADVSTSAWYYDAVSYVYANGLMDGVSSTQFNPDGTMTRAMVWAILARIDGQTVTGDGWIETAREWAMSSGVSDGENANGAVTREQLVTMLWRYAGEPEGTAPLSAWSDAASVSDWAAEAMSWAIDNGVITGMSADTLAPQGSATRAQCAAILMRCADLLA